MKKILTALLAAALILALAGCSSPTSGEMAVRLQEESSNSVTVSGKAGLEVKPDVAKVSVGVSTRGTTPAAAREENAKAINATLEAVKALGVEEKDIQTSGMDLWNNYDDNGNPNGYRMSTSLTILVRDMGKAGEVVDAAIGAGSNQLNGLEYLVSNQDELYNQVLTDAVELARQKAEALAAAANRSLGVVKEINETSRAVATVREYAMANPDTAGAGENRAKTAIQPGSTTINAEVTVVFTMT